MTRILIKNGTVVTFKSVKQANVLINENTIEKIAPNIEENFDQVIDATGKLIFPGLVDVHVHFRDPGFTQKETVQTGSLAAAHGGYTTVCTMPNVKPVPNTPKLLKKMIDANMEKSVVKIRQIAPISVDRIKENLNDLEGLKKVGAIGFSNDGSGVQSTKLMLKAMEQVVKLKVPIAAHLEDESLMGSGVINDGQAARRLGLAGITELAETTQLARDLELARATGVHYHVCHISTKRSVQLVRQAKADVVHVTAEVTPHHLLLDDSMIKTDDPAFKMNPPLRSYEDRQALLVGLIDGTIDAIATDHAPHTVEDKEGSFETASFGISGLETALPLIYSSFVKTGILSLSQLVQIMSYNPAQIFKLDGAGQLQEGNAADIIIFDPNKKWKISNEFFESKGHNSPFIGRKVFGKVQCTIVNGKIVFGEESK
ncbi:dihydroorotase [Pediococcus claussenii]|uniref:dihydroorotase n=1 Tax=Pediococcus claussenii TaxID=187452 RepID=UPI00081A2B54|nr:dihydroorotase [Pediococcus claussenii]ANZ69978.1 dihydroorotase [Pediococcus claussenii]ANZ71794.1 dihydroorotase [Pediococcus claussenii]